MGRNGGGGTAELTTPLMRQYFQLKEQHPDALLLFRLGDFYEMFGEDALVGSKELDIALTTRDRGKEHPVPMCGVPHHALDGYLAKLLERGYKVAICEQMEDPATARGLVRREVVRIVTPGTVLEPTILAEGQKSYLLALAFREGRFGLAFVEASTGEVLATELSGENVEEQLRTEVAQKGPREVLYAPTLDGHPLLVEWGAQVPLTKGEPLPFAPERAAARLRQHLGVATLEAFGLEGHPLATAAAGAALAYLEETQKRSLEFIGPPRYYAAEAKLVLDATTLRNLEVLHNLRGGMEGTLLELLDHTVTPMGKRLLCDWIQAPLVDPDGIGQRLDAVEELATVPLLREDLREALKECRDPERLLARVVHGSGNARDLLGIRKALSRIPELRAVLEASKVALLKSTRQALVELPELSGLLNRALSDDPPPTLAEGGLIKEGFDEQLDALRKAAREGKNWIAALESAERQRTGIKSLKVGYTSVFGYYLEVRKSNLSLVPSDYERKQTVAGGERFVTAALKEKEALVLDAEERSRKLELELFRQLREAVAEQAANLRKSAAAMATADVLQSLAEAAVRYHYGRPTIEASGVLEIEQGRHPVVERQVAEGFVPNDLRLDGDRKRFVILTGPNMAGKSTFLRQTALIVLLAQLGSFVPAAKARIGLVDRIFTRVGAFDDLVRGQSTFMVEMVEVARILRQATRKSLVLLDEIGRGTSTFDGLALAWATAEYLYNANRIGAKTLMATHYHHLTELGDHLDGVLNLRMEVQETEESVVFLRRVVPGKADKSYGIEVARLAGVPQEVLERAKEVLRTIEQENLVEVRRSRPAHTQLRLEDERLESQLASELQRLDLTRMTPLEALLKLSELQRLARREEGKRHGPDPSA